jgi:hypothetical protein
MSQLLSGILSAIMVYSAAFAGSTETELTITTMISQNTLERKAIGESRKLGRHWVIHMHDRLWKRSLSQL